MMIYRCYFALGSDYYRVDLPSIHHAKDGFWVDEEYEYCIETDKLKYWISPSVVRYCERIVC